jgi:isoquinoline 1-oxidoreductase beta subunit
MPTAAWRSVYFAQARNAEEILMDEIAKAMGADPVATRRKFVKPPTLVPCSTKSHAKTSGAGPCHPERPKAWQSHAEYRSIAACLVQIDRRGAR